MKIVKQECDEQGRVTYNEYSDSSWGRREYNEKGRLTYEEHSDPDGFRDRCEYDEQGRVTYCENSYGYWGRYHYDKTGISSVTTGRKNDDVLLQMTAEEKEHYIQSIEFARDWGDNVSAADYQLYLDIVAERKEAAGETAAHKYDASNITAEQEEFEEAEL